MMKMAFILFDKMTTLDFVGFYEAVTWMGILQTKENVTWDFCSNKEEIKDDRGLTVKVNHVSPDLSGYDLIFIPGGLSTRQLRYDTDFISWIQTARDVEYKVSVCTGALILGAAGFLNGKKATTNPSAYELLAPYCSEVVKERFVRDGNIFTGGGVSASIDLGLYVIESLTNEEVVRQVQEKMDYPYYPSGKLDSDHIV
ncbi:DJ-1/PfpI family protein [Paenibacillus sp. YSY-4.3]